MLVSFSKDLLNSEEDGLQDWRDSVGVKAHTWDLADPGSIHLVPQALPVVGPEGPKEQQGGLGNSQHLMTWEILVFPVSWVPLGKLSPSFPHLKEKHRLTSKKACESKGSKSKENS